MPQPLSERTASFTDSVIRRMTRVSLKYGAVNLSQGFPDFDPPQAILERLAQVAREGPHQYSVTWGAQNFREALARKQSRYMGRTIDPDKEIVATCGSTEAMMCAMMTVTNPGDKVIVFSPFYENYGADTILSGAEPIYVPLHLPAFTFDVDELEAAFRQRPKALVLCNPSNPCGRVFTREELLTIAEMATKYDTYVITDEVYEHIVYAPPPAHLLRHPAGDVEPDAVLLLPVQDLLHHRLAAGIHHRAGGDHRPGQEGPRLSDGGLRRAAAGGGNPRPGVRPGLL